MSDREPDRVEPADVHLIDPLPKPTGADLLRDLSGNWAITAAGAEDPFLKCEAKRREKELDRLADLLASPRDDTEVLREIVDGLVEWADKYPPGRVYPFHQGKRIESELQEVVTKARTLHTQEQNDE